MRKNSYSAYLYILPCVLFIGVFLFLPIVFNLFAGFTSWKGLDFTKFRLVGLNNYQNLFSDAVFLKSLVHTVIFMVLTLFFQLSIGLLLTILLDKKLPGYRIFETVYFLPVVLSSVIVAYTFNEIYEPNFGALNTILGKIGLGSLEQIWLGNPSTALYCVLAANIYQWTGIGIIYYRAGLSTISNEVYEAADIDGASFWQTLLRITIPLLKNIHLTLILLGTIGTLKFFDLVYIMTKGGPAGATEFPMTYLYKRLSLEANYGLASALAIIIIVIATLISALELKISSKYEI